MAEQRKIRAFLSYSSKDEDDSNCFISSIAKLITATIHENYPFLQIDMFVDRNIRAGSDWINELSFSAAASDFLIAILTPSYFSSNWCLNELINFLSSDMGNSNRRKCIFPIYLIRTPEYDKTEPPAEKNLVDLLVRGWKAESPKLMMKFFRQTQHVDLLKWSRHSLEDEITRNLVVALSDNIVNSLRKYSLHAGEASEQYANTLNQPTTAHELQTPHIHPPRSKLVSQFSFMMGAPDTARSAGSNERPCHHVQTDYDFMIGINLVTFDEFDEYCKSAHIDLPDDAGWGRGNLPVVNVSYESAKNYCKWLADKFNHKYRLPTEAEWEYVCTTGLGNSLISTTSSLNKIGNVGKSVGRTTPVNRYRANLLGIFDMVGNLREWCEDSWHENYRGAPTDGRAWIGGDQREWKVVRGASWADHPNQVRPTFRSREQADRGSTIVGFRIAYEL